MKIPVCKLCGKKGHYASNCYQRGKLLYQKRKLEGKIKPSKISSVQKAEYSERKKLIKELDKYFSLYIRLKDSDRAGYATCITCGVRLPYHQLDAGHWQSRKHFHTRWDERDVFPQCQVCNRTKGGNYAVYNQVMLRKFGQSDCEEIKKEAFRTDKIPTIELMRMLGEIKRKYRDLVLERQAKGWRC